MMKESICSLHAGDLEAVFLPGHGMIGASLRHRGAQILQRIEDLDALEPMTSPANALMTSNGLQLANPGDRFRATFRVRVEWLS
jgi:hypothetical protein